MSTRVYAVLALIAAVVLAVFLAARSDQYGLFHPCGPVDCYTTGL